MNIVFDFGAVLFTWKPVDLVTTAFSARAVTEASAKQLAHAVFGHADWHAFDRGLMEIDAVVTRTASRLRLEQDAVHTLMHSIGQRLVPIPETLTILQSLHAKREQSQGVDGLYFLSNMPVPYARELEQTHSFLKQFDGGIFSGDVLCSKPDPGIYSLLQSRYNLVPGNTVFIDDLKANVEAARALGWTGIHFHSPEQLADELRLQCGL